jgi:hypothetical protein
MAARLRVGVRPEKRVIIIALLSAPQPAQQKTRRKPGFK